MATTETRTPLLTHLSPEAQRYVAARLSIEIEHANAPGQHAGSSATIVRAGLDHLDNIDIAVIESDAHAYLRSLTPHLYVAQTPSKEHIPESLRWEIWERDNFTCRHCGTRQFLRIDHIHPESKGGGLDPDNLQTLCRSCNSRKGTK